jgi:uridylate kinase
MNKYKRILLKLSGEALAKDGNTVDPNTHLNGTQYCACVSGKAWRACTC